MRIILAFSPESIYYISKELIIKPTGEMVHGYYQAKKRQKGVSAHRRTKANVVFYSQQSR